jgi:hypothetical protein
MSFKDIALPLAQLGIPVTPLLPRSKVAFITDWPKSATTDLGTIDQWDRIYGDCNVGAVAGGGLDDVLFFEIDSPDVLKKIEQDTGHNLLEEVPTFRVRSRMGRGHFYFRNTPKSIAMGNIGQSYGPWSVRQRNMYVVSAGSIHPHSNEPYTCLTPDTPVLPIPDWLVDWLIAQTKKELSPAESGEAPRDEKGLVPHGFIHSWLVTQAGRLRYLGIQGDTLETALIDTAHRACAPPLDENKIRQVARSFNQYESGPVAEVFFNQKPEIQQIAVPVSDAEIPTFNSESYPAFPKYVWAGTSIYENFVKPICEHNSRIDYFMWLPAMALLLNYVGVKVKTKGRFDSKPFNGSMYMTIIGKRGETNKSSSIDDAFQYFHNMGCLWHYNKALKTADGKSTVWTAGSMEGFCIDMQRINCKNGIFFYDELSQLIKKAGIDNSTLVDGLLSLYESKSYGNSVKTTKEAFSLESGSYCVSFLACCTTNTFQDLWSGLVAADTGLNDRFFFVLEPEELPVRRTKEDINTLFGSQKTRALIDKAMMRGEFEIENPNNPRLQELVALGNRYYQRAVKWAVGIAIDLGLDVIDDECIERGCDIVKYEISVKNFLKSYDANNKDAALQLKIRSTLERNKGSLKIRDLKRVCHADREGTYLWDRSLYGLIKAGYVRMEQDGTARIMIKRDDEDAL